MKLPKLMTLEHPDLPSFERLFDSLAPLVFEAGIDDLRRNGLLNNPSDLQAVIAANPSNLNRFIRGCHYGWDLAQRKITRLVVEYEESIHHAVKDMKQDLRNRNRTAASDKRILIDCLKSRQIVLRRLADVILYHLVRNQHWIPRRFSIEDSIQGIDPAVLTKTVQVASELNRADRRSFHLVSDLTTAVQIGDLVALHTARTPPELDIIELKDGKLNLILAQAIEEGQGKVDDNLIEKIRQNIGDKAIAQARRMERQYFRMQEFGRIVNTDEGIDPKYKVPLKLTAKPIEIDDYGEALREAVTEALSRSVAVRVVGGCFRLIAVDGASFKEVGISGITHLLYHLQFGVKKCTLRPDSLEELEMMKGIFPFADLVTTNHVSMWPPPIFLWPMPKEQIHELLFQRVRIFGQLDYDRLFALAGNRGIEMRWARDEELGFPRIAKLIPGSPRAKGVRARLLSGPEEREHTYFAGFFGRIFLELIPPNQLLDIVRQDLTTPLEEAT